MRRFSVRECHRVHGRPFKFDIQVSGYENADSLDPDAPPAQAGPIDAPLIPFVRPAARVFSAEELAARLDRYAARAEARLPLFADGAAEPEPVTFGTGRAAGKPVLRFAECYACGARVPAQSSRLLGWHCRMLAGGQGETESYCPECFALFAWGDAVDE